MYDYFFALFSLESNHVSLATYKASWGFVSNIHRLVFKIYKIQLWGFVHA